MASHNSGRSGWSDASAACIVDRRPNAQQLQVETRAVLWRTHSSIVGALAGGQAAATAGSDRDVFARLSVGFRVTVEATENRGEKSLGPRSN